MSQKVFLIGGSGYIGEAVALALRRAGHKVTALVRSKEKATSLLAGEVDVVVGDVFDLKSWVPTAKGAKVLINAGADYKNFATYEKAIVDGFTEAAKGEYKDAKDIPNSAKKLLVYVSGAYSLKVTPGKVLDEDDPIETEGWIAERPKSEKTFLTSPYGHGVVVRPPKVFGGRSQHFYNYFEGALKGSVLVTGPKVVSSVLHVDDLANAFVRLLAVPVSTIAGEIIHVASHEKVSDLQIAQAFAVAAGFKGSIATDESKAHPLFDRSHFISSEKAYRLLGWRATHSIIDDAAQIFASWQARPSTAVPVAKQAADILAKPAAKPAEK